MRVLLVKLCLSPFDASREGEAVMTTEIQQFSIAFPEWYDERLEYETPFKGYLENVIVQTEDGSRYSLCFYDPVRLQQTLEDDARLGHPYFAEAGLVILPRVDTSAIREAIAALYREDFFRNLKPVT